MFEKEIEELENMIEYFDCTKMHVKDVQKKIDELRARAFEAFYRSELEEEQLHNILMKLMRLEDELHMNYVDFKDKFKIITLPREEWIYYTGKSKR